MKDNNGEQFLQERRKVQDNIERKITIHNRRKRITKRIIQHGKKTISIMGIIIFAFSLATVIVYASVPAFREGIRQLLIRESKISINISLLPTESELLEKGFSYSVSYVPEDFYVKDYLASYPLKRVIFENEKEEFIYFDNLGTQNVSINNEVENKEEILINGEYIGFYSYNDKKSSLSWSQDNQFFTIYGDIDKPTTIKMAENLKIIKEE